MKPAKRNTSPTRHGQGPWFVSLLSGFDHGASDPIVFVEFEDVKPKKERKRTRKPLPLSALYTFMAMGMVPVTAIAIIDLASLMFWDRLDVQAAVAALVYIYYFTFWMEHERIQGTWALPWQNNQPAKKRSHAKK